jgi:hypothetical protein
LASQRKFTDLEESAWKMLIFTTCEEARSMEHVKAIMDRWTRNSEFVPTRADIVALAGEVPDPATAPPPMEGKCQACGGCGYTSVYALHSEMTTREGRRWTKKEWLTPDQAVELEHRVDWRTQSVHQGSKRCFCMPPRRDDQ